MNISNEIEMLKNKIVELEKKQQRQENEHNIELNLDIIKKDIEDRLEIIYPTIDSNVVHTRVLGGNIANQNQKKYRSKAVMSNMIDATMMPQLQAIYNVLYILTTRIDNLENSRKL